MKHLLFLLFLIPIFSFSQENFAVQFNNRTNSPTTGTNGGDFAVSGVFIDNSNLGFSVDSIKGSTVETSDTSFFFIDGTGQIFLINYINKQTPFLIDLEVTPVANSDIFSQVDSTEIPNIGRGIITQFSESGQFYYASGMTDRLREFVLNINSNIIKVDVSNPVLNIENLGNNSVFKISQTSHGISNLTAIYYSTEFGLFLPAWLGNTNSFPTHLVVDNTHPDTLSIIKLGTAFIDHSFPVGSLIYSDSLGNLSTTPDELINSYIAYAQNDSTLIVDIINNQLKSLSSRTPFPVFDLNSLDHNFNRTSFTISNDSIIEWPSSSSTWSFQTYDATSPSDKTIAALNVPLPKAIHIKPSGDTLLGVRALNADESPNIYRSLTLNDTVGGVPPSLNGVNWPPLSNTRTTIAIMYKPLFSANYVVANTRTSNPGVRMSIQSVRFGGESPQAPGPSIRARKSSTSDGRLLFYDPDYVGGKIDSFVNMNDFVDSLIIVVARYEYGNTGADSSSVSLFDSRGALIGTSPINTANQNIGFEGMDLAITQASSLNTDLEFYQVILNNEFMTDEEIDRLAKSMVLDNGLNDNLKNNDSFSPNATISDVNKIVKDSSINEDRAIELIDSLVTTNLEVIEAIDSVINVVVEGDTIIIRENNFFEPLDLVVAINGSYVEANLQRDARVPTHMVVSASRDSFVLIQKGILRRFNHGLNDRTNYYSDISGNLSITPDSIWRVNIGYAENSTTFAADIFSEKIRPMNSRLPDFNDFDIDSKFSWLYDTTGYILNATNDSIIGWKPKIGADTLKLSNDPIPLSKTHQYDFRDLFLGNGNNYFFNDSISLAIDNSDGTFTGSVVSMMLIRSRTSTSADVFWLRKNGPSGSIMGYQVSGPGYPDLKSVNGSDILEISDWDMNSSGGGIYGFQNYVLHITVHHYTGVADQDSISIHIFDPVSGVRSDSSTISDLYVNANNRAAAQGINLFNSGGGGQLNAQSAFFAITQLNYSPSYNELQGYADEVFSRYGMKTFNTKSDPDFIQIVGSDNSPPNFPINLRSNEGIKIKTTQPNNLIDLIPSDGFIELDSIKNLDFSVGDRIKTIYGAVYTTKAKSDLTIQDSVYLNGRYKYHLNNGNVLVLNDDLKEINLMMFGADGLEDGLGDDEAGKALIGYLDSINYTKISGISSKYVYEFEKTFNLSIGTNDDGTLISDRSPSYIGYGATIKAIGTQDTLIARKAICSGPINSYGSTNIIGKTYLGEFSGWKLVNNTSINSNNTTLLLSTISKWKVNDNIFEGDPAQHMVLNSLDSVNVLDNIFGSYDSTKVIYQDEVIDGCANGLNDGVRITINGNSIIIDNENYDGFTYFSNPNRSWDASIQNFSTINSNGAVATLKLGGNHYTGITSYIASPGFASDIGSTLGGYDLEITEIAPTQGGLEVTQEWVEIKNVGDVAWSSSANGPLWFNDADGGTVTSSEAVQIQDLNYLAPNEIGIVIVTDNPSIDTLEWKNVWGAVTDISAVKIGWVNGQQIGAYDKNTALNPVVKSNDNPTLFTNNGKFSLGGSGVDSIFVESGVFNLVNSGNDTLKAILPAANFGRTWYVSPDGSNNINDVLVGDPTRPARHPWMLKDSLKSLDNVVIVTGIYDISNTNTDAVYYTTSTNTEDYSFLVDSVNFFFEPGAELIINTNSLHYLMYDTLGYRTRIYGEGTFTNIGSGRLAWFDNENSDIQINLANLLTSGVGDNFNIGDCETSVLDVNYVEANGGCFVIGTSDANDVIDASYKFYFREVNNTNSSNFFEKQRNCRFDGATISIIFDEWIGNVSFGACNWEGPIVNTQLVFKGNMFVESNLTNALLFGGIRGDFYGNNWVIDLNYTGSVPIMKEIYRDISTGDTPEISDSTRINIRGNYLITRGGANIAPFRIQGPNHPYGVEINVNASVISATENPIFQINTNNGAGYNFKPTFIISGGNYVQKSPQLPVMEINTTSMDSVRTNQQRGIFINNATFINQNDTAVITSTAGPAVVHGEIQTFGNDLTQTPETITYTGASGLDTVTIRNDSLIFQMSNGRTIPLKFYIEDLVSNTLRIGNELGLNGYILRQTNAGLSFTPANFTYTLDDDQLIIGRNIIVDAIQDNDIAVYGTNISIAGRSVGIGTNSHTTFAGITIGQDALSQVDISNVDSNRLGVAIGRILAPSALMYFNSTALGHGSFNAGDTIKTSAAFGTSAASLVSGRIENSVYFGPFTQGPSNIIHKNQDWVNFHNIIWGYGNDMGHGSTDEAYNTFKLGIGKKIPRSFLFPDSHIDTLKSGLNLFGNMYVRDNFTVDDSVKLKYKGQSEFSSIVHTIANDLRIENTNGDIIISNDSLAGNVDQNVFLTSNINGSLRYGGECTDTNGGATDTNGDITISVASPIQYVTLTPSGTTFYHLQYHSITATDFKVRVFNNMGIPVTSTVVDFTYCVFK